MLGWGIALHLFATSFIRWKDLKLIGCFCCHGGSGCKKIPEPLATNVFYVSDLEK